MSFIGEKSFSYVTLIILFLGVYYEKKIEELYFTLWSEGVNLEGESGAEGLLVVNIVWCELTG